ncbi:MAG TPA: hypothetical protein VGH90_10570, partial [Chthoniobacteraceae bacterium]
MRTVPPPLRLFLAAATLAILAQRGYATRLTMEGVEATFQSGSPDTLHAVINGRDSGKSGWSVKPQVDCPQAIVFRTS